MVTFAIKAGSHFAAWLIWQSMRVSVLDNLDPPKRAR
jgi:hypothetical protein